MKKLKCVLLVDDDESTNMLHKIIIQKAEAVNNIEVAETAKEALDLLECPRINDCKNPDIIFLDLNMPGMTGWDFLDKFKIAKAKCPVQSKIFILTTSSNPDDIQRAYTNEDVAGFISKPLTIEKVNEIRNKYFPN